MQYEAAVDGPGIGIEQKFRGVEAMALSRKKWAVRPQSITSTMGHTRDMVVKNVASAATQSHATNFSFALKQAEFDRAGVGGKHGDVDSVAVKGHAEWLGFAV